ncbi:MAG: hypothetical protein U0930_05945 [Pirellulales bacterium]
MLATALGLTKLNRIGLKMKARLRQVLTIVGWLYLWHPSVGIAQSSQNPSPMVEHVREHPRLEKTSPPGTRHKLELGELFIPESTLTTSTSQETQLVMVFHCGNWIPELAVSKLSPSLPCVSFQLGSGSGRYSKPFQDDAELANRVIGESEKQIGKRISELILVGWSAGYGSVSEFIQSKTIEPKVTAVLLIDGLHASYADGKPGPQESKLITDSLEPFLSFAKSAAEGRKKMIILHSEIFPGTFASTTETSDWLIKQLELKRTAVLRLGPMRTQQLGETIQGKLQIRAYAGNSAPDHVDLLHGLPEFLDELMKL